MSLPPSSNPPPPPAPARSAVRSTLLGGIVALAVAMGIGRFAFTPLLPLMVRDGTLDALSGADWASANYVGYLVGALSAGRLDRALSRNLLLALAGITLVTVLAAVVPPLPWGAALRFLAGVFSAWVLILASSGCLAQLARWDAAALGAWIYSGVGLGIATAGIFAWWGGRQPASWLWAEMGALAAAGTWIVHRSLVLDTPAPTAARPAAGAVAQGQAALIVCYGLFGFGYIVPATFLPSLARSQVADPLVFGLTWPLFGASAALSIVLAARALRGVPRQRVWAAAQAVLAVGTALPALRQSLPWLAASAVLVGGTFMVITMAGLQLARERAPVHPTRLLGRMTAAFAVGQIAGPVVVRVLAQAAPGGEAVTVTSALAALLLAASAGWLWR
jgi:MFS family permease